jgi:hypothetical protein
MNKKELEEAAKRAVENIIIDIQERFGVELLENFTDPDYLERLYMLFIMREFDKDSNGLSSTEQELIKIIKALKPSPRALEELGAKAYRVGIQSLLRKGKIRVNDDSVLEIR